MQFNVSGVNWGISYVVATNPTDAYEQVRRYLDDKDIGFAADRELESIKLVAEDVEYPECRIKLHLPEGSNV
jgi:hypothetical protein